MARDVTEREFVNYAKGLGSFCTYGETREALVGVLKAFALVYPSAFLAMARLSPPGIGRLVDGAGLADPLDEQLGGSPASREVFLETLRVTAGLRESDRPGHVLRALLGTIKEKSQDQRQLWAEVMPSPLREDWDGSITIDQVQDAGQCL